MKLLVNCICSSIRSLGLQTTYLGSLVNPRRWDTLENIVEHGLPYAADNDAFVGFHFDRYIDMLQRLKNWGQAPLFVTLPDVVADAEKTIALARIWSATVRTVFELPAAYVIQDGQHVDGMPWDLLDAVFIGGSTEYKLGHDARLIVAEAKRRGHWVHMGRVNTRKRIIYAHGIGCDSVDGSGFNLFRDTHLPWAVDLLTELGGNRSCEQLNLAI